MRETALSQWLSIYFSHKAIKGKETHEGQCPQAGSTSRGKSRYAPCDIIPFTCTHSPKRKHTGMQVRGCWMSKNDVITSESSDILIMWKQVTNDRTFVTSWVQWTQSLFWNTQVESQCTRNCLNSVYIITHTQYYTRPQNQKGTGFHPY